MLVGIALVALTPLLLVGAWSVLETRVERRLRAHVTDAAHALAASLQGSSTGVAAADIEAIAALHAVRLRVFDGGGSVVAEADATDPSDWVHELGARVLGADDAPTLLRFDAALGPVLARPEVQEASSGRVAAGCRASEGSKILLCHAVERASTASGETRWIYAQESTRRAARSLYDLRFQMVRLSLFTCVVALGLAAWLGRTIVGPIEALKRRALTKAGSPNPRGLLEPEPRDDEVGELSEAFDALLAKLDLARGENERFVADLVHELKNPLAAVRAVGESLERNADGDERTARLVRILRDSTSRLDRLVSQLLDLARAEAGMLHEPRTDLVIGNLAEGIVFAMREAHPQVDFEVICAGDTTALAVAPRLESVLRNLIENAATLAVDADRRAPAKPRVVVEVTQVDSTVRARVSDNGPGIAEEHLPRVFDRFFTTRGGRDGTGLGLALVKAVIEAHQGGIEARNGANGGAVFELWLPRNPSFTRNSPLHG
jgi:two-component system sensor histidine kinase ChvG